MCVEIQVVEGQLLSKIKLQSTLYSLISIGVFLKKLYT